MTVIHIDPISEATVRVNCNCDSSHHYFEIYRDVIDENAVEYSLSVNIDNSLIGLWQRSKDAYKTLFGKNICNAEVCMKPEQLDRFIDELIILRNPIKNE